MNAIGIGVGMWALLMASVSAPAWGQGVTVCRETERPFVIDLPVPLEGLSSIRGIEAGLESRKISINGWFSTGATVPAWKDGYAVEVRTFASHENPSGKIFVVGNSKVFLQVDKEVEFKEILVDVHQGKVRLARVELPGVSIQFRESCPAVDQ